MAKVISWEEEKGSVPGLSIDGADLGANEDGGGGGAATAMSPTSPFSPLFSGGLRNFGCRVKATILAARNLPRPKSEARYVSAAVVHATSCHYLPFCFLLFYFIYKKKLSFSYTLNIFSFHIFSSPSLFSSKGLILIVYS